MPEPSYRQNCFPEPIRRNSGKTFQGVKRTQSSSLAGHVSVTSGRRQPLSTSDCSTGARSNHLAEHADANNGTRTGQDGFGDRKISKTAAARAWRKVQRNREKRRGHVATRLRAMLNLHLAFCSPHGVFRRMQMQFSVGSKFDVVGGCGFT